MGKPCNIGRKYAVIGGQATQGFPHRDTSVAWCGRNLHQSDGVVAGHPDDIGKRTANIDADFYRPSRISICRKSRSANVVGELNHVTRRGANYVD